MHSTTWLSSPIRMLSSMIYGALYAISNAALSFALGVLIVSATYGFLYLILGQRHALIRYLESTYTLKRIREYTTIIRDNIFYLSLRLQNFAKKMSDGFKSFVVNTLPIKYFLKLAKYLPIGSWLEFEEQDPLFGSNSLMKAIRDKDLQIVDGILTYASPEAVLKYVAAKDKLDQSPLFFASIRSLKDASMFKKILNGVFSEKRLELLMGLGNLKDPFFMRLAFYDGCYEHVEIVMESLREDERAILLDQIDEYGFTYLIILGLRCKSQRAVEGVLKYYPKDKLLSYLMHTNYMRETAVTYYAWAKDSSALEYIFSLIPEHEMKAFLEFNNQGQRALLIATAKNRTATKALLEKHGVILPENLKNITKKQLKLINDERQASARFEKRHGSSPATLLGIDIGSNMTMIHSAYRKKIVQVHPDRNKNDDASAMTVKVKAAYDFYRKPETRIKL